MAVTESRNDMIPRRKRRPEVTCRGVHFLKFFHHSPFLSLSRFRFPFPSPPGSFGRLIIGRTWPISASFPDLEKQRTFDCSRVLSIFKLLSSYFFLLPCWMASATRNTWPELKSSALWEKLRLWTSYFLWIRNTWNNLKRKTIRNLLSKIPKTGTNQVLRPKKLSIEKASIRSVRETERKGEKKNSVKLGNSLFLSWTEFSRTAAPSTVPRPTEIDFQRREWAFRPRFFFIFYFLFPRDNRNGATPTAPMGAVEFESRMSLKFQTSNFSGRLCVRWRHAGFYVDEKKNSLELLLMAGSVSVARF